MVARGRGKKAAAAAAGPAVAAEAEAVMSNGDASQGAESASEVVAAAIAPTKKGRQRGVKKETKEEDETPSVPAVEVIAEKAAKPTKASKGSKKAPKGKAAAVALVEEDEKVKIPVEDTKDEDLSENDSASIEAKPAVAVEKKASIRKRKVDNIEKAEETEEVAKKAPRVTKTKGAKKETVDSDGIPEDPAAAVVSITVLPTTQTNGTKKSASRKRGAPKVEEPEPEIIPKETKKHKQKATVASEEDQEAEDEIPAPVLAKRGSKSKSSKKEPKEIKKAATTKTAPTKSSKKAPKVIAAEEAEEEATEHDILPEDEFVPEIEEEEAEIEEPKPKKVVKSKGSRKQVIPAPTPPLAAIEEDNLHEPIITEDEPEEPSASEKQESEADSASAIDEELPAAQPKSRGRKPGPAAKKEKVISTKKVASKRAPKGGKKATKDEPQEDQQETASDGADEKAVDKLMNNEINEEDQDAADVEISKLKRNGTAEPTTESAAPKAGRGRKRAAPATVTATPITETDKTEKKPGRGRKRVATAPPPPTIEEAAIDNDADDDVKTETDGSKIAKLDGPLNPTKTEYNSSDFTIDKEFNMKISSWNIAGLRAWLKKDGLSYLQHEKPDILCLQEIKCTPDKLPEEARIPGYHPYWLCMPGGHGGVAVYSKIMPINVEYGIGNAEHDESGRIITAEYEKFYLISVYVQNSGRGLVNLDKRMRWEELFREYLQKLEKVKPVIIAGDMNVSHKEIDLANPKTNTKSAGFTPQEREEMTKLLASGYVDTFRHFHPDQKGAYTFWTYMKNARAKNVGWRLDYFILSERIVSKAVESTIRPQVLGSDHCPITLFLNI